MCEKLLLESLYGNNVYQLFLGFFLKMQRIQNIILTVAENRAKNFNIIIANLFTLWQLGSIIAYEYELFRMQFSFKNILGLKLIPFLNFLPLS